jgi:3-phosphoshikimate 1-carboxyvinyltransferase
MMKSITPVSHPIHATVNVPGSKSITNRALICAALAEGESVLLNASDSTDTALMANGLNQLGVLVRKSDNKLIVSGSGGKLFAPKFPIPVGNAGTTLRFLLSLSSLAKGKVILEGDQRMAERPNDDLVESLTGLGVKLEVTPHQSRFAIEGDTLRGGSTTVEVEKSSQFLSSLLMVSSYAKEGVVIHTKGEQSSEPYVAMTLAVMKQFGLMVDRNDSRSFSIQSGQRFLPTTYAVEADASSASYFLAAAAICGGDVLVQGMKRNSLQGDAGFISLLEKMGVNCEEKPEGMLAKSDGTFSGIETDMNAMPDLVPTLAVLALFAQSSTHIKNVAHLHHKESDRLQALETELRKLGANVTATHNSLEIVPTQLHGAQLDIYDDHRLAMSFSLIGLRVPDVVIENPQCVKKSFPGYWQQFEKLSS